MAAAKAKTKRRTKAQRLKDDGVMMRALDTGEKVIVEALTTVEHKELTRILKKVKKGATALNPKALFI